MSRELVLLEKLEKELSLKELQIKSLLTITQAINEAQMQVPERIKNKIEQVLLEHH